MQGISRWLVLFGLILLAACGSPKYQIITDKIPPSSPAGLACVERCGTEQTLCAASCRQEFRSCESACQSRHQICMSEQETAAAKQLPIALIEYNQALGLFHDKLDFYHQKSIEFERNSQRLEERLHRARHRCAADRKQYQSAYFEKHQKNPSRIPESDLAGCIDADTYERRLGRLASPEPPLEPEPVTLASLTERLQAERCHLNCGCNLACGCASRNESCFLGCGGELRQRRVCVKNCDKI